MKHILIDEGTVKFSSVLEAPELFRGGTFRYRRYSYHALGQAGLYYLEGEKPDWICEIELEIMAMRSRPEKIKWASLSRIDGHDIEEVSTFGVHWSEDGTAEIAFSEMDVFGALLSGDAEVYDIPTQLESLHIDQFILYSKITKLRLKNSL